MRGNGIQTLEGKSWIPFPFAPLRPGMTLSDGRASVHSPMTFSIAIAGCIAIILSLAHSILGERMVLRRLMAWDGRGSDGSKQLSEQQRRVLWASWHLVTVFGLGFAATLLRASGSESFAGTPMVLAVTFLAAALYWFWATRGRHPAWILLVAIGLLLGWNQL